MSVNEKEKNWVANRIVRNSKDLVCLWKRTGLCNDDHLEKRRKHRKRRMDYCPVTH